MTLTEQTKSTIQWYDDNAKQWSQSRKSVLEPSFWQNEYENFQTLKKDGKTLLEIGSGSGREALEWQKMGYHYTGFDLSKNLLHIAQETMPEGLYFHGTSFDLPFDNNAFDASSSWSLLPHIPKKTIDKALTEIKRVLKDDGLAFFAMRKGIDESKDKVGRWFSYYSQNEFKSYLDNAGFHVIDSYEKYSRRDLSWLIFFCQISI